MSDTAPCELGDMTPSSDLVRALVGLDRAQAGFDDQLAAVAGWERVISWATACQAQLLVDIDNGAELLRYGLDAVQAARSLGDQVGLALGVSGGSAQHRMNVAATWVEKIPAVHTAMQVGVITSHHARLAASAAAPLEAPLAQRVAVATLADEHWRTPSQFAATFARFVIEFDPAGADERHRRARRGRRVSHRSEPDGMGSLWALLPAEDTQAVYARIDACARSSLATNAAGDVRTLDERRADALVRLVLGRIAGDHRGNADASRTDGVGSAAAAGGVDGSAATDPAATDHAATDPAATDSAATDSAATDSAATDPAATVPAATVPAATDPAATDPAGTACEPTTQGRNATVHVTVSWSTLIGLDDAPADLTGHGPVTAATARRIAADPTSTWYRLLVDPASGRLLDHGRTVYRPPQDLRDFVIARDRTCRFPGCDRAARTCDLDHRHDWEDGGRTSAECVGAVCRRHHQLKHQGGWAHFRDPDTDDSWWFDPHGRVFRRPAAVLPSPEPVEPPHAEDPPGATSTAAGVPLGPTPEEEPDDAPPF